MVNNFVTFFLALILLLAGLATLMFDYYRQREAVYHYRNTFPYELNYLKLNTLNIIGKVLITLSLLSLSVFYIIYPIERLMLGEIEVIASFVNVIGVISIAFIIVVAIVNMKNIKLHLIMSSFLFAFGIILTIAIAVMGFWTLRNQSESIDIKKIVCSSIACVFFLIQFILLINPKLKNWYKLEEKSEDDGIKVYVRPQWFSLAYTEWSFIFFVYLDASLLFFMFL